MHKLGIEWVGDLLNLIIRPSVWMIRFPGHEDRQAKTHPARLENPLQGDQKPGASSSDHCQQHAPVNNGRKELLTYGVMNGSLQKGFLQPKGELGRSCQAQ